MTTTDTLMVRILSSKPKKEVLVEIVPGDTATAVLEKAGLDANDYMLMMPGNQNDYAPGDSVWESAPDGGKLHVVPSSTAC